MKRKFFATVVTLALSAVMLVGCGSSSAETAINTDDAPAEFADTADYVESDEPAIPDDSDTDNVDVEPYVNEQGEVLTQAPNDDIAENDNFGQAPEEDIVSWDEMTEDEEDATEEAPVAGDIEGIIVLQADWRTGVPIFTVSAINPDTGDYHNVSSFTFEIAAPINADDYTIAPFAYLTTSWTDCLNANYASLFNSDYTCMTATKTFLGNEEKHAGWIDQSGNFFDVTEALGEGRQSDFEEVKKIIAVGFTDDNNFVYLDGTNPDEYTYRFVPLDNIVPGASYPVDDADKRLMWDRQTWGWLKTARPTNWVSEDQFLTVSHSNGEMVCALANVSDQSITEIVPTGSLASWSPVLGPDGLSVAFMAAPAKGTDNPTIYLTDISGNGTPTKLETSYLPINSRISDGGSLREIISIAYCYSSVLEWR